MLIVLTSERVLENEAGKLNTLFEEGLELLHFRKPTLDSKGYSVLLDMIQPEFHPRIMLHQYHELVKEFNLRGVHLQEQPRYDLGAKLDHYISQLNADRFAVSSSFHTLTEIEEKGSLFEYCLLSPVFSSISKAGYEGKGFDVTQISNQTIVGMGGINEQTIPKTYDLGLKESAYLAEFGIVTII